MNIDKASLAIAIVKAACASYRSAPGFRDAIDALLASHLPDDDTPPIDFKLPWRPSVNGYAIMDRKGYPMVRKPASWTLPAWLPVRDFIITAVNTFPVHDETRKLLVEAEKWMRRHQRYFPGISGGSRNDERDDILTRIDALNAKQENNHDED